MSPTCKGRSRLYRHQRSSTLSCLQLTAYLLKTQVDDVLLPLVQLSDTNLLRVWSISTGFSPFHNPFTTRVSIFFPFHSLSHILMKTHDFSRLIWRHLLFIDWYVIVSFILCCLMSSITRQCRVSLLSQFLQICCLLWSLLSPKIPSWWPCRATSLFLLHVPWKILKPHRFLKSTNLWGEQTPMIKIRSRRFNSLHRLAQHKHRILSLSDKILSRVPPHPIVAVSTHESLECFDWPIYFVHSRWSRGTTSSRLNP